MGVETGGKISRQTAQGIISRLRQARPPELPWTQITHLAEMGAAGVQHPQAEALEHLSRRLVLTAAIVATLGTRATGQGLRSNTPPRSPARPARAGGVFSSRSCPRSAGTKRPGRRPPQRHAELRGPLDCLVRRQRRQGAIPRPQAQTQGPAPPPPPSEPADPEAVKAFKERLARHQAAKNHQPQGGTK